LKRNLVIAIDGPAGSGKSTAARRLAKRLGISYIDSGAVYRAITLQCINEGIDIQNSETVDELLRRTAVKLDAGDNGNVVFLNGRNVTAEIRLQPVTAKVSAVSALPAVRKKVTQMLRQISRNRSIVLEGRDIGTAVFPNADLKIYMEASIEERSRRRYRELHDAGVSADLENIKSEISRRDLHDSQRSLDPLSKAADAIVLNNTEMSIDDGVEFIAQKVKELVG
jgi:cytidylate kinase